MPRIARSNLNTSFFHVIVQGINKEYIFYKEDYIKEFKKLLFKNLNKFDIKLISYCIMNNHAHMLIYTKKIEEMSQYMKSINISYARYYNRNENRVGIVFRNRYESEPIFTKKHLLNCIGYIHNNPIKAKMVSSVKEYKYSSYNDYINEDGIVDEEIIKLVFGDTKDYLLTFESIHNTDCKFKDYVEATEYNEKYKNLKQQNFDNLISNKDELKKTIEILVIKEQIPINKVSEILKISRFKISRILKKERNNAHF